MYTQFLLVNNIAVGQLQFQQTAMFGWYNYIGIAMVLVDILDVLYFGWCTRKTTYKLFEINNVIYYGGFYGGF